MVSQRRTAVEEALLDLDPTMIVRTDPVARMRRVLWRRLRAASASLRVSTASFARANRRLAASLGEGR